jgi:hypothetical protein
MMPNVNVFYQNGYTSRLTAKLFGVMHARPAISMRHSRVQIAGAYFGSLNSAWKKFIRMHLLGKSSVDCPLYTLRTRT